MNTATNFLPFVGAIARCFRSSIGKKFIVAITGAILISFLVGHLLGNLQIFLGRSWINGYAKHLEDLGPLLWLARIFLLVALILHIKTTAQLAKENRAARPKTYRENVTIQASKASQRMILSGLTIFVFILYHLAHFTLKIVDSSYNNMHDPITGGYNVYGMMVRGFNNVYVSGFYILAIFLLSLHVSHGFSSLFQTLGLNGRRVDPLIQLASKAFAIAIFIGYISIPSAVLLKLLQ